MSCGADEHERRELYITTVRSRSLIPNTTTSSISYINIHMYIHLKYTSGRDTVDYLGHVYIYIYIHTHTCESSASVRHDPASNGGRPVNCTPPIVELGPGLVSQTCKVRCSTCLCL